MKHIMTILALLVLLTACAPRGEVMPSAQPAPLMEKQLPPEQQVAPTPQPSPPEPRAAPEPQAAPAQATTPKTVDVEIKGFRFNPAVITVKKGDAVRWTNQDSVPHTATGSGFDTGTLQTGQSGEVIFDKAGTYDYICSIHPRMKAKVIVE